MEIGESGAHGALAVRRASKENNQGNENVTHQLHSMVERNVKETPGKLKIATNTSLVQVNLAF